MKKIAIYVVEYETENGMEVFRESMQGKTARGLVERLKGLRKAKVIKLELTRSEILRLKANQAKARAKAKAKAGKA